MPCVAQFGRRDTARRILSGMRGGYRSHQNSSTGAPPGYFSPETPRQCLRFRAASIRRRIARKTAARCRSASARVASCGRKTSAPHIPHWTFSILRSPLPTVSSSPSGKTYRLLKLSVTGSTVPRRGGRHGSGFAEILELTADLKRRA